MVDLVPQCCLRAGPISLLAKFDPSGRWRSGLAFPKEELWLPDRSMRRIQALRDRRGS